MKKKLMGEAMPIEEVKITFYRVKQCGYYAWGTDTPTFGSVEEALQEMAQWSNGVALQHTKLLDPEGNDPELPVYLLGIHEHNGDWTLATWNEVPAHEGGVASVSRQSVVGQAEVHMNEIRADSIPGYATYFWFVPQHNVVASVRFTHNISGQEGMRSYVEKFLELQSSHVVEAENDGVMQVVGYSEQPGEPVQRVKPRFRTSAFVKAGHVDHVIRNHARIRKVIRRGNLSVTNRADRAKWQQFVSFLRGQPRHDQVFVNVPAYIELAYTPELNELQQMIQEEMDDPGLTAYDDMGFILEGEPQTKYWVSKSFASDNFDLDIQRDSEATVALESLSNALHSIRARILRLLRNG